MGLKSGQIFSYERSNEFGASEASATYDQYASALRMIALTFTPSKGFEMNHSGVLNSGEVRLFCTILNKEAPQTNAAPSLGGFRTIGIAMTIWALLFTMDVL